MTVVATLSKGYDLDYVWKQVERGRAKDAAGYYIQASESGGEPPGRWWGPGAKALGFEHEPHATAERRRGLRIEGARQARLSPLFFDLTISLSNPISIFHASLGENARLPRQAGDQQGDRQGDRYWSALVDEVDDMIWQAVWTGFAYFQREAGYTRTGSHNTRSTAGSLGSGAGRTWRSRTGCSTPTSRCPAAPTSTSPTCSPPPRNRPTPAPGPRPAPELARDDQIYPERTGVRARTPGQPRQAPRCRCVDQTSGCAQNSPLWHAPATVAISSKNVPNGASGTGPGRAGAM
jgi:hypothetical protein